VVVHACNSSTQGSLGLPELRRIESSRLAWVIQ
jgi:hypothetical protein